MRRRKFNVGRLLVFNNHPCLANERHSLARRHHQVEPSQDGRLTLRVGKLDAPDSRVMKNAHPDSTNIGNCLTLRVTAHTDTHIRVRICPSGISSLTIKSLQ
jgi:hypothetical protein